MASQMGKCHNSIIYTVYAPSTTNSPWAMLNTPIMLMITAKPRTTITKREA